MQQWVSQQKSQHLQAAEVPIPLTRDKQVDQLLTTVQKVDLNQTTASIDQLKELQQALEDALTQVKQKMRQA